MVSVYSGPDVACDESGVRILCVCVFVVCVCVCVCVCACVCAYVLKYIFNSYKFTACVCACVCVKIHM